MVLYADPNDYFCTENLNELVEMLPCKGHSGILSALNFRNAFQGKYLAAEFHYQRTSETSVRYSVKLMTEYNQDEPFLNLVHNRLQKCEIYDHSTIVSSDTTSELDTLSKIVYGEKFIQPSERHFEEREVGLLLNSRRVVGKWYGFSSQLVH